MSQVVPNKSHPTSTRGDKISLRESFRKVPLWSIFLFVCTCAASSARADEPTELIQLIRNLSDQLGSKENEPDQFESARSRQRFEVQRSALQAANRSSSREWNAIQTQADWVRFRDEKLQALRDSLSREPWHTAEEQSPSFQFKTSSTLQGDGFQIDKILYESRPGWWISANLYRPVPDRDSMPGIIISHSHHTPKEHGELQDMGMTWARAGCLVLIPDHLGHGERRQHPFGRSSDYDKKFRVGPADYYFRYDNSVQLDILGESLLGWMVRDLSRGADVLLSQPRIDSKRLILLGAVAGGGDPAAVTGALDPRFAAVVPFNFGGPQPETRFPLPPDAELSFQYAGSGSWESTRNLRRSATEGYLPWVIVGSIAPRHLIYGHEFRWDQEHDPVWKRLVTIYQRFETPEKLAFTHGHGELKGQAPEASHCTHIGLPHRIRIHRAFDQWFQIKVSGDNEYSNRFPAEKLKCWTDDLRQKLQPQSLSQVTSGIGDTILAEFHAQQPHQPEMARLDLSRRWDRLLGSSTPTTWDSPHKSRTVNHPSVKVDHSLLKLKNGEQISVLRLTPVQQSDTKPIVLGLCSSGFRSLLSEKTEKIAAYLKQGSVVCLMDLRGIGPSQPGAGHGRRSEVTSFCSTALMLGTPTLGQQLSDVRFAMSWLRSQSELQGRTFEIWAESLIPPNPDDAPFRQPRDDDQSLPTPSQPQAALVALLAGLYENDVTAIDATGCVASWKLLLDGHLVLMSYESLVPGVLTAGDICDLIENQSPKTQVTLRTPVDGMNRRVPPARLEQLFAKVLEQKRLTILTP